MNNTQRYALRLAMLVGLGALALGATGCATRVYARPGAYGVSNVAVYSAPPAPRVVVSRPPPPYGNAVWVEGHWQWNGNQYVWADGYYVEQRPGYVFTQPRWERQGGRHVYVQGGWAQGGRVVHVVGPGAPVYQQRQGVVVARPGGVVVQQPGVVVARPGGVVVQQPGVVVARPGGVVVQAPGRRVVATPGQGPVVVRPGGVRVQGPGGSATVVVPR